MHCVVGCFIKGPRKAQASITSGDDGVVGMALGLCENLHSTFLSLTMNRKAQATFNSLYAKRGSCDSN
jgi:hypothetical protein